jgi:SAM-dependent methyltransferase
MVLFREFRREQSDPERFYRALAEDSVDLLRRYGPLDGRTVLDVGAGPGWFRRAFEAAGARYLSVDPEAGDEIGDRRDDRRDRPDDGSGGSVTVRGSGLALPVRSGSVDVAFSSNVAEHVPRPWRLADELVRAARPGGLVLLSYTAWYGPHGGHESAPWHYLGGRYAAERYARVHGRRPKNDYGVSLFPVTVRDGLRWARGCERDRRARLVDCRPRYLPDWASGVVRLPGVREVLTWNVVLVLRP